MATSNPPNPIPGAPGRRDRRDGSGGGAWTPDLPRPDWWVDGAEAMGRDWPRVQASAWDGPAGRSTPGRRGTRHRRREPAPRLPYAALAAARGSRPGPGRGRACLGRALAGLRRALAMLGRALGRILRPGSGGEA